jgi:hypothetical protein
MNSATSGLTSAANDPANFALSRNRYPSCDERIGGHRLAFVRSECSNVNQRGYVGIVAGFRDDNPTIGVADENDGAILSRKRPLRNSDVSCQRQRWVLNDRDCIAVFPECVVNTLPAGTIDKPTVNQNNILQS